MRILSCIRHQKNYLTDLLDANSYNTLEYQVQYQTDRSMMKTKLLDTDAFLKELSKFKNFDTFHTSMNERKWEVVPDVELARLPSPGSWMTTNGV